MKNGHYLRLVGTFILLLTLVTSCSSDDDAQNPSETPSLLDKWWYDSNDFAADIYFHSNGEYQQKKIVQGTEYTGTGNWVFEDEDSRIIRIDNLEGTGQVSNTIWLKITNLQNHTITVQQSINGTDYSAELFYRDTNN
ncbi:hypothetical protein [Mangrovimonas spongiae]|uniref:Lipocalin-like domain-containing protein n=1 Tax=Mangrovimonas spongiae TaxID=2494697 RepID=A0A3R9MGZ3_9FLAO|nr:hypothetical protein [Mangrovimonas spongiae]RSK40254.1 hypothetical protein EJA19_04545 [Mangrovimonas spongiae]